MQGLCLDLGGKSAARGGPSGAFDKKVRIGSGGSLVPWLSLALHSGWHVEAGL